MGRSITPLLKRLKDTDLHSNITELKSQLRPWALKVGRAAARPLLQFYYVMASKKTPIADRVLIYAAIAYTIWPIDLLPRSIYKLLGILDDGAAVYFVYKKIKSNITPEVNAKVESTLNEWFETKCKCVK